MKSHKICAVLVLGGLISFRGEFAGVAKQTSDGQLKPIHSKTVKTDFRPDAQLSATEVKQVVELAKKCGIKEPGEVRTVHYIPGGGKGIVVESARRIDGRNTFFDTIDIHNDSWGEGFYRDKTDKRVGEFWANAKYKYSTHLRSFEFKKEAVQISIGEGIKDEVADTIISLIAAGKVRFEPEGTGRDFGKIMELKPTGLIKDSRQKNYELHFSESLGRGRGLIFRFEKGQIIVTGTSMSIV